MQRMKEEIELAIEITPKQHIDAVKALQFVLHGINQSYIELEKQQIQKAFVEGDLNGDNWNGSTQYFNQTYNR